LREKTIMGRPYNEKDLNKQRIIALFVVGPIPILMFIIGAIIYRESVLGLTFCIFGAIFFSILYSSLIILYKIKLKNLNNRSSLNK